MRWLTPKEIELPESLEKYSHGDLVLKKSKKDTFDEGKQILESARQASESILAHAHNEAEKIMSAARQEYQQGFTRGKTEGKQAALKEAVIWLIELHQLKGNIFRELKEKMAASVEHIVKRVFREYGQDWLKTELDHCLSSIIFDETIQVHVSESVTDLSCVMKPQQARGLKIQVIPEASMALNICIVRTRYFEMEISQENVYQQVINILMSAFKEVKLRHVNG